MNFNEIFNGIFNRLESLENWKNSLQMGELKLIDQLKHVTQYCINGLSFSEALIQLKNGKKIRRKSWNKSSEYLYSKLVTVINKEKIFVKIYGEDIQENLWSSSIEDFIITDWEVIQ